MLDERVLVEEAWLEVVSVLLASDHPPDVVRLPLGRGVDDIAVPAVGANTDRNRAITLIRDERHPLDNLGHASHVILRRHVRDTIAIHDLGATELQVGSVDFPPKEVVQGRGASEDDRLTLDLNSTLAETNKVGANT